MKKAKNVYTRFLACLLVSWIAFSCAWMSLVYQQAGQQNRSTYEHSIVLQERLSEASGLPSPKLVAMGGSSTALGFDDEIFAAGTGMPAINLGLTASHDIAYMTHVVKKIARPGDYVLFGPEFAVLSRDNLSLPYLRMIWATDPAYIYQQPLIEQPYYWMGLTWEALYKRLFVEDFESANRTFVGFRKGESRERTRENQPKGYRLHMLNDLPDSAVRQGKPIPHRVKRILQNLRTWAEEHSVRIFIVYAPTLYFEIYETKSSQKFLRDVEATYRDIGFDVLGNAYDNFFERHQMWDSAHHLMREAQIERTQWIITQLRKRGALTDGNPAAPSH